MCRTWVERGEKGSGWIRQCLFVNPPPPIERERVTAECLRVAVVPASKEEKGKWGGEARKTKGKGDRPFRTASQI